MSQYIPSSNVSKVREKTRRINFYSEKIKAEEKRLDEIEIEMGKVSTMSEKFDALVQERNDRIAEVYCLRKKLEEVKHPIKIEDGIEPLVGVSKYLNGLKS